MSLVHLLCAVNAQAFPATDTEYSGSGDLVLTSEDAQEQGSLVSSGFAFYFMTGTGGAVLLALIFTLSRDREGPCRSHK